jgi:hypothetical protein
LPAGPPDLLKAAQDAGSQDVDPTNPSHNPASTTRVNTDLFDSVTNLVGPFGFSFSEYQIVPQPGAAPIVHRGPTRYPPQVPHQPHNTLRVANFNMENLFAAGMVDDGHTFTHDEVDAKTTRLANAIGRILDRPDVVVTEEVAALAPLEEVAAKLRNYTAYWLPSTDARHIAVGCSSSAARRPRTSARSASPRRRLWGAAPTIPPPTSSSSARRWSSTCARTG